MSRKLFLKRAAAILTAIVIVIPSALFTRAAPEITYSDSGYKSLSKLNPIGIRELVGENQYSYVTERNAFETAPSTSAPYAPGKLKDSVLGSLTSRLNMLRRLAGLDPVACDAALCGQAQYGAVLIASSDFSHTPAKPDDMSDDFYNKGYAATMSSNLAMGYDLMTTPDAFLHDTDEYNIEMLGHRRWMLNPALGKVGFGYAVSGKYEYTDVIVFDRSAAVKDYDFISWPASGYFPTGEWFSGDAAWSITLNPSKYRVPEKNAVKVTLTEKTTGRTRIFSSASSDGYFNVNNDGYGVRNCIIFRPEPYVEYKGEYTVTVTGLKKSNGSSASLSFKVLFFDCDDEEVLEEHVFEVTVTPPTCTLRGYMTRTCVNCGYSVTGSRVPPLGHDFGNGGRDDFCSRCGKENPNVAGFTDVSPGDYFAEPVRWAVRNGITTGTSTTKFSPYAGCTRGQIVTFLWRAAGAPEPEGTENPFGDVRSGDYFCEAVLWAVEKGITTGTDATHFSPNSVCTRGQIVTFLWRANGEPQTAGTNNPFRDVKPGDYFRDAVLWAVEKGITLGTDATHFSPNAACTRGQVVTFLYRDANS